VSYKFAFFKGLRLYHSLVEMDDPITMDVPRIVGLTRKLGKSRPDSPSATYNLSVRCWWDPQAAVAEEDTQTAFNIATTSMKKDLIDASQETGPLSWVRDSTRKGDVDEVVSVSGLQAVDLTGLGGSWTPTAGRYILFRDPDSGEGFVVPIVSWSSPAVTVNIPVLSAYPDTTWEVYDVQFYYPQVSFKGMVKGGAPSPLDNWRPSVIYSFESSEEHPQIPTALRPDLS
jgi:hypothetical protein